MEKRIEERGGEGRREEKSNEPDINVIERLSFLDPFTVLSFGLSCTQNRVKTHNTSPAGRFVDTFIGAHANDHAHNLNLPR